MVVYIFVCSQDRSHSLLQSVPLSEVEGEWGRGTAMRGLLSSFCLFTDHLSPSAIRTLYTRGIYSSAKFYERIYTEHETPLKNNYVSICIFPTSRHPIFHGHLLFCVLQLQSRYSKLGLVSLSFPPFAIKLNDIFAVGSVEVQYCLPYPQVQMICPCSSPSVPRRGKWAPDCWSTTTPRPVATQCA